MSRVSCQGLYACEPLYKVQRQREKNAVCKGKNKLYSIQLLVQRLPLLLFANAATVGSNPVATATPAVNVKSS
jgi:hypothetical protein